MRDIDPRSNEIWVLGPHNYLYFYNRKFGINVLNAKQDFTWEKTNKTQNKQTRKQLHFKFGSKRLEKWFNG